MTDIKYTKTEPMDIDSEPPISPALPSNPEANYPQNGVDSAQLTDFVGFRVGELFWARFQRICGWPCMVHPNGNGEHLLPDKIKQLHINVRFFGDNGRSAILAPKHLTPYTSFENNTTLCRTYRKGAKSTIMLQPKLRIRWELAVQEANILSALPHNERLEKFAELVQIQKEVKVEQQQKRKADIRVKVEPVEDTASTCSISLENTSTSTSIGDANMAPELASPNKRKSANSLSTSSEQNESENDSYKSFEQTIAYFVTLSKSEPEEHVELKNFIRELWKIRQTSLAKLQGAGSYPAAKLRQISSQFNSNLQRAIQDARCLKLTGANIKKETTPRSPPQKNRPIAEVIDDILNLEKRCLLRDIHKEPTKCKYCMQAEITLVTCLDCKHAFHDSCLQILSRHMNVRSVRLGPKYKPILTGQSVCEDGRCAECSAMAKNACSICFESKADATLLECELSGCGKKFHASCTQIWPQADTKAGALIRCPAHKCHTCFGRSCHKRSNNVANTKDLLRCTLCPATYHDDMACVPAGSNILSKASLVCPRHHVQPNTKICNHDWCYHCGDTGVLFCCDQCPRSVTKEPANSSLKSATGSDGGNSVAISSCRAFDYEASDMYLCGVCVSGILPVFGEIVWAKYKKYRYWPAVILPPSEVPQNLIFKQRQPGEFVVRFFGSNDHAWLPMSRVMIFESEDDPRKINQNNKMNADYTNGLKEARSFLQVIKQHRTANRKMVKDYQHVTVNRYIQPFKYKTVELAQKCNCSMQAEHPCGPDSQCLNRAMGHECDPRLFEEPHQCENMQFEERKPLALEVVRTGERGYGLVTREFIAQDTFIIEYVGDAISDEMLKSRMEDMERASAKHFYFLNVGTDYTIDAGPRGNLSRFMNHSCEPNCETQKWFVRGVTRVGLFARHDIQPNTELTFDYAWSSAKVITKPCVCDTEKCTGKFAAPKAGKSSSATDKLVAVASAKSIKRTKSPHVAGSGRDKPTKAAIKRSKSPNADAAPHDKSPKSAKHSKSPVVDDSQQNKLPPVNDSKQPLTTIAVDGLPPQDKSLKGALLDKSLQVSEQLKLSNSNSKGHTEKPAKSHKRSKYPSTMMVRNKSSHDKPAKGTKVQQDKPPRGTKRSRSPNMKSLLEERPAKGPKRSDSPLTPSVTIVESLIEEKPVKVAKLNKPAQSSKTSRQDLNASMQETLVKENSKHASRKQKNRSF